MKKLAKVLIGIVVVLLLAVVGAFAAVNLVPWSSFKGMIAEQALDATGRVFAIDGDLTGSLSLGLALDVKADGVRLANAAGAAPDDMLKLGSLRLRMQLLPLLTGNRLVVDEISIREPVINLAVDEKGQPNWVFGAPAAPAPRAAEAPEGLPLAGVRIAQLTIEKGALSYDDKVSGQRVTASEIDFKLALPSLDQPLKADGSMLLNKEKVTLSLAVDTPKALIDGPKAKTALALDSKHIKASYAGAVQSKPVAGLDGDFNLDVASVGRLLAWLDRPLAQGQPDPGPLKVRASFAGDGAKLALKQATIQGNALDAKASGSFDGSGAVKKLSLAVESGVLDIDRYLPPPAPATPAAARPAGGGKMMNPLQALSDAPLDLAALKGTDADVKVALKGVKAKGFEVGPVDFTATLKGGVLSADLARLGLYGGGVTGKLKLDAAAQALGLDTALTIDKVRVDRLAEVATGEKSVVGVASGTLAAQSQGQSPRALAQNLKGKLDFTLGEVANAPGGAITEVALKLDLPGLKAQPKLAGHVVYNKEKVAFTATVDPLQTALERERFNADLKVTSKPLSLAYQGAVQHRPVPGLDGKLDLDIPSVGALAAWLGQPLAKDQPDPGPLKVAATMRADGKTMTLKEATLKGNALDAKASGSFDGSGAVKKLNLVLESGMLDLDRYLPAAAPTATPAATTLARPGGGGKAANPLDALSDEPFDLAALKGTDADVKVTIKGIKAKGYEAGPIDFAATLKGGVLNADLARLGLYGGGVSGKFKLDAAAKALGLDTTLAIDKVRLDRLAELAGGEKGLAGIATGTLAAQSQGQSPRALAQNLKGKLDLTLGEVANAPGGAITEAALKLDLPGLKAQSKLGGHVVYNKERVEFAATVDPLQTVLERERFNADLKLNSKPLTLAYAGAVQHRPVPGLDGKLDLEIPSVGTLAAWLGQPLAKGQQDPGPLKLAAVLQSDGKKTALKQATITGKALDAKASGSFEAGTPARFDAKVDVVKADVDAYLPPEDKKAPGKAPASAAAGADDWSDEPYDFAALRSTDGQAVITLAKVTYRGLAIDRGRIRLTMKGGIAETKVEALAMADGTVNAAATLDASDKVAKLNYRVSVKDAQARPLLTAFAGNDRLSGTANIEAEGQTRGSSEREMVKALNGKGKLQFLNGAIHGINIAAALRKAQSLGFSQEAAETQKTDFAELGGSYVIANGVVDNRDFKMLAPLLRLGGAGTVPMPPRTVDYTVEAKLVASLQGQGGKDALAGVPIPIKVIGTWAKPQYVVDWNTVFKSIAADPARLANLPGDLSEKAKGMGIALPGLGGTSGAGSLLQGLTGGGTAPSGSTGTSGGTAPAPSGATEPKKPSDLIKGLFK